MMARFCHAPDAVSANDLREDIEVQYKTAFLWLHKFRLEVTEFMNRATLGSEVEIDGGHFGGTIRPKNVKKERRDLRTVPYRDPEREMMVTFAVERNGSVRAWVAKREGHPRKQIENVLAPAAVLFTDSAPSWNEFRGRHRLIQVNHNMAYSTPEACTNSAESAIRSLRAAEDVHRHIAQNYLDLYAGEAGWRVTHNKQRKGERLETLAVSMATPGRSALVGYFQGKKRLCQIIDAFGKPATWRPPTRAERDAKRIARGKSPIAGPYRPRRTPNNWSHGFSFVKASDLAGAWQTVQDLPGVYVVCLPIGSLAGWQPDPEAPPMWRSDGYEHVYTGETYGLRSRLREHLTGTIGGSNLRETLLALDWDRKRKIGAIAEGLDRKGAEDALTEWLLANALIGFKHSAHIRDYERDILAFTASPLNVMRDVQTGYSRHLKVLRKAFRDTVTSRWSAPDNGNHYRQRR